MVPGLVFPQDEMNKTAYLWILIHVLGFLQFPLHLGRLQWTFLHVCWREMR